MAYELNDQDRELARQIGMQQFQQSQPVTAQKPKKDGGIGSFLLGMLPGGSLLDKGLKGEEISGGDIATEAALSLVPFGLGKLARGAKGIMGGAKAAQPGLLSRVGKGLENKGQDLLGTQANLTRAEGRRIGANPAEILGGINRRTGLTKMDDMAQVAKGVTGQDGAYSELTRNAVGNIPGVDIGDIRSIGADILANKAPLITGKQKDSILESFNNSAVTARGGSAGSLNPLAAPQETLDMSRNFRAMASDITKSPTVSAKDRQLANVYNDLAKNIEDRIYSSPGIDEGLKLAAPDRAADLLRMAESAPSRAQAKAYKKLAEEIQGIGDVKSLRTAQKDFVNLGKVDEATARAQAGAGAQLGDQMQGLGKIAQKPTNLIAMPLNAATPAVGGMMTRAGRALQGTGGGMMSNPAMRFLAPQAGVRLGADALGLRGGEEAAAAQQEAALGADAMGVLGGASGTGAMAGKAEPQSMYSRENAAMDIQNDLQRTGGENMEKYLKLYEFMNPETKGGKANATTQKALAQSANADSTLQQLEAMMQQAGGAGGPVGGNLSSFFGGLGLNNNAKTYNDLASGSVTQIAKALGETGAMSDSDRVAYQNLIPKITDTQEVAAAKFAALRERMAAAQNSALQYGAGSGIEDALAEAGY